MKCTKPKEPSNCQVLGSRGDAKQTALVPSGMTKQAIEIKVITRALGMFLDDVGTHAQLGSVVWPMLGRVRFLK